MTSKIKGATKKLKKTVDAPFLVQTYRCRQKKAAENSPLKG